MLLDGEQLNRRFLQLLRSLIHVWSQSYGTILLTVENWHLAEEPLRQLLLQLSQSGLLCLATSRQALVERESASVSMPDQLPLAPFPSEEVQRWIRRLFPTESDQRHTFYAELFEHAQGNPLYLQEIRRMIVLGQASEMVLVSLDSWFDLKVHDLGSELRRFLEAGAVLGQTFLPSNALKCAELPTGSDPFLAEAVQRRFLTETERGCFWVHDLIREAVLRSIEGGHYATLSGRAALLILQQPQRTQEQTLLFPLYFQRGKETLRLAAEERREIVRLLTAAVDLMRKSLNQKGAHGTLGMLRDFMAQHGMNVSDDIWLLSAEIAFESGEIAESIEFVQKPGRNIPPVMKIQRELILCRCFLRFTEFHWDIQADHKLRRRPVAGEIARRARSDGNWTRPRDTDSCPHKSAEVVFTSESFSSKRIDRASLHCLGVFHLPALSHTFGGNWARFCSFRCNSSSILQSSHGWGSCRNVRQPSPFCG